MVSHVTAMNGTAMSPAEMKKGRPGLISRTELNTRLANTFPAIGTRDSQELQKEKTLPAKAARDPIIYNSDFSFNENELESTLDTWAKIATGATLVRDPMAQP
ncbi:unnamed protein product, partial [Ixodes hexagonus]